MAGGQIRGSSTGSAVVMRSWSSQDRGRVRSGARPRSGLSSGWAVGRRSPGKISMSCDGRPPGW